MTFNLVKSYLLIALNCHNEIHKKDSFFFSVLVGHALSFHHGRGADFGNVFRSSHGFVSKLAKCSTCHYNKWNGGLLVCIHENRPKEKYYFVFKISLAVATGLWCFLQKFCQLFVYYLFDLFA